jgi:hypothetical protein
MCPGLLKPHRKFGERDGHCVNCVVSESNKVDVSGSSRNVYMSRASRSISVLQSTSENGKGFEIVAFRSWNSFYTTLRSGKRFQEGKSEKNWCGCDKSRAKRRWHSQHSPRPPVAQPSTEKMAWPGDLVPSILYVLTLLNRESNTIPENP